MRTVQYNPEEATGENHQVTLGPAALDHEHTLAQRGEEHSYSEEFDAYVVTAIMHCTDPLCGYAESQEWDDAKHVDDLVERAVIVEANNDPWTTPVVVEGRP